MDSTPAQTKASPAPIAIAPAAMCTACIDEPQNRLTVVAAARSGSPARKPIRRATFRPCSPSGKAQPTITSSIACGSIRVRSISAATTWAASSSGRTRARLPLWAGWNGERA